jgi:hypothetical protein
MRVTLGVVRPSASLACPSTPARVLAAPAVGRGCGGQSPRCFSRVSPPPATTRWVAVARPATSLHHASLTSARHASTYDAGGAAASASSYASRSGSRGDETADDDEGEDHQGNPHDTSSRAYSPFESYRAYRRERHAHQEQRYQTLSVYLERMPPGFRELLLYSPLLALLYFVLVQARVYYRDDDEPWYHVFLPSRWRYSTTPGTHVSSLLKRAPTSEPIVSTAVTNVSLVATADAGTTSSEAACHAKDVHVRAAADDPTPTPTPVDEAAAFVTTTTYRYRAKEVGDAAAAAQSGGVAPPVVAPFHEVAVRQTLTEHIPTSTSSCFFSAKEKARLEQLEEGTVRPGSAAAEALARKYPYGVWGGPLQVLRDPTNNKVMGYSTGVVA